MEFLIVVAILLVAVLVAHVQNDGWTGIDFHKTKHPPPAPRHSPTSQEMP